jgi:hypothetical protein
MLDHWPGTMYTQVHIPVCSGLPRQCFHPWCLSCCPWGNTKTLKFWPRDQPWWTYHRETIDPAMTSHWLLNFERRDWSIKTCKVTCNWELRVWRWNLNLHNTPSSSLITWILEKQSRIQEIRVSVSHLIWAVAGQICTYKLRSCL